MSPGRPALDPDAKLIQRQHLLKRYAVKWVYAASTLLSLTTKNSKALRASAVHRMRRLRAKNPLSDEQIASKKQAAARYCEKNRHDIRAKDKEYRTTKAAATRPQPSQALDTPGVYGIYGVQARDLVADKRATTPHRPKGQVISNAERSRRQLESASSTLQTASDLKTVGPKQRKPLNLDEVYAQDEESGGRYSGRFVPRRSNADEFARSEFEMSFGCVGHRTPSAASFNQLFPPFFSSEYMADKNTKLLSWQAPAHRGDFQRGEPLLPFRIFYYVPLLPENVVDGTVEDDDDEVPDLISFSDNDAPQTAKFRAKLCAKL
ncbi:hypothetical protein C8R43DRAFT_946415 [Mycena crocata]|nr:hypothetical protein C8R43DRAFT_946415 [Mycena crocata]